MQAFTYSIRRFIAGGNLSYLSKTWVNRILYKKLVEGLPLLRNIQPTTQLTEYQLSDNIYTKHIGVLRFGVYDNGIALGLLSKGEVFVEICSKINKSKTITIKLDNDRKLAEVLHKQENGNNKKLKAGRWELLSLLHESKVEYSIKDIIVGF